MSHLADTLFLPILVFILGVAAPLLGAWEFGRLKRDLAAGKPDARLSAFRWTIVIQWSVLAVFLAWWLGLGRGLEAAGMGLSIRGWQWLPIGLGLAAVVFLVAQAVVVSRSPARQTDIRSTLGDVACIVPRTRAERTTFGFLSLTAGICEEALYRGLLIGALTTVAGVWPAVFVSTVVFGLGHAYQGGGGILKTGLAGLIMALLTVFSGSIWVSVVLHAVNDAASGIMLSSAVDGSGGGAEPECEPEPAA